jgi:hypothetical protein
VLIHSHLARFERVARGTEQRGGNIALTVVAPVLPPRCRSYELVRGNT